MEILNLHRTKSGSISGIKGESYISKKMLTLFLETAKKFEVIDQVTGENITEEITGPLLEKMKKISEKKAREKFRIKSFKSAPEELIQKKIERANENHCMPNKKGSEFNFVDLFCGAGGLSIGLEQAGMTCVLGSDINTYAMQSFRSYHKNAETYCGSISSLSSEILKEKIGEKKIDLVCGGPPCQGFSTIGRGDKDDQRNSLFEGFIRVVRVLGPTYILFENVSGLLAAKNEKTLHSILASFKALGYRIKIKILESQHYGVPQKRKRTIILGCKENYAFDFPKPVFDCLEGGQYVRPVNLGDVIDDIKSETGEIINHQLDNAVPREKLTIERVKCIPEGRGIRYKKDEDDFFPDELKLGLDWSTMKEGRLRELRYFRLARNAPSPTINTINNQYYHPKEHRRFTVRELARIQTFPNDFKFFGNIVSQKKLVGNAVPSLMGKALGLKLMESFTRKEIDEEDYLLDIKGLKKDGFCYRETLTDPS